MSYIVEGVKLFAMLPMYPVAAGFKPALPVGDKPPRCSAGKIPPATGRG